MAEEDTCKDQKKLRKARIITPPNVIKMKIGSGGIGPAIVSKAERGIEDNTVDFRPICDALLKTLTQAIEKARNSDSKNESYVEGMLYPAAQFKAQGSMFHF